MTPTPHKDRHYRRMDPFGVWAVMIVWMVVIAGVAGAQTFTSTLIPAPANSFRPSIALAVNIVNGTSYAAYLSTDVIYGTKPSGGSWTEEDLQMVANEVALTTTQFTQGNVKPHLAMLEAYKPGPPILQGCVMWATRSTDGVWTYEVVDPRSNHAYSASIALNTTNVPHIAYVLQGTDLDPHDRLELATRVGPNNWQIETVDSLYGEFDDVTIRMWGGPEILTYGRIEAGAPTFRFLYAQRSGSTWTLEDIEPTASNPQNGAMTLPPGGLAQVAYWTNDGMLNYAYRAGANNWVRTKLGPALSLNVDRSISIIYDPSVKPHIAYYSQGGDSIRYASSSRFGWAYQRVAPVIGNFGPLSIGIHSANPQRPKVAYQSEDPQVGDDRYYLAEGTQLDKSNYSATRPVEESEPPRLTAIEVSGGPITAGGPLALSISQVEAGSVELVLVDVAGRAVAHRAPEWLAEGRHAISWDIGTHPSGMYFVRMKTSSGAYAFGRVVIAR
jgi:hypothetical protein